MNNVGFVKSAQEKELWYRHFFPVAVMGREVMLVIVVIVGHVSGSKCNFGIIM